MNMYMDAEKWDFCSYNQDATSHTQAFWTGPATHGLPGTQFVYSLPQECHNFFNNRRFIVMFTERATD